MLPNHRPDSTKLARLLEFTLNLAACLARGSDACRELGRPRRGNGRPAGPL